MTKTEFLLTISIQYQAGKWWEERKYQLGDFYLIQYQVLRTNTRRIVWQAVRRITNEILGVKGLKMFEFLSWATTKLNYVVKLLLVFFINFLIHYFLFERDVIKILKPNFSHQNFWGWNQSNEYAQKFIFVSRILFKGY